MGYKDCLVLQLDISQSVSYLISLHGKESVAKWQAYLANYGSCAYRGVLDCSLGKHGMFSDDRKIAMCV